MSKKDIAINKGPQSGNSRSKALNATRRKWNVNLQSVKIFYNGSVIRTRLSAKALRTLKNKKRLGDSNLQIAEITIKGVKQKVFISQEILNKLK